MYSCGPPHRDKQVLGEQLEPIYNSSVFTQDTAWKTFQEQWTIEKSDKRCSGKSVLVARHDDEEEAKNWSC